jgi:hypothetical protein
VANEAADYLSRRLKCQVRFYLEIGFPNPLARYLIEISLHRNMDLVWSTTRVEQSIRGSSKEIAGMALEYTRGLRVLATEGAGSAESSTARV